MLLFVAFYAFHIDRIDANESSQIASWFYVSGQSAEASKRFLMWLPPLLPRYFVSGIDMVVLTYFSLLAGGEVSCVLLTPFLIPPTEVGGSFKSLLQTDL